MYKQKIYNDIKIIGIMLFISSIISSFYIDYIGKHFNKTLYNYLSTEVKRFTSNIVNTSVNEILEKYNHNELIVIKLNNKEEITAFDFNTRIVNKLLKEVNNKIHNELKKIENGKYNNLNLGRFKKIKNGILCEIPIAVLQNNSAISNIGPTIPIKLSFTGNVKTTTKTNITSYGINNVILEVNIITKIDEQVTMPISSKNETITLETPLILKIIPGKVPEYYETDLKTTITSSIFNE